MEEITANATEGGKIEEERHESSANDTEASKIEIVNESNARDTEARKTEDKNESSANNTKDSVIKEGNEAGANGKSELKQQGNEGASDERQSVTFQSKTPEADSVKLLEAIKAKKYDLVNVIFNESRKLRIDFPDDVGKTALHYLCNIGCISEIKLCLKRNPDVNKTDKIGWTPLHYAAMKGHTEVVQLLVDNGGNVNKPDSQKGRTPLHLAVSRNHQEIAETLIICGADPNIADQEGKTAAKLSRNEYMKDKLELATLKVQNELGEVTVETMEISSGQPTSFPNLGLTVTPTGKCDAEEDTNSETDNLANSFTMTIKKSATDKLDELFTLEDTEDVCSDIFTHKLARASGQTEVEISILILTVPEITEELVLKTDKGKEIILTNVKEENEKWQCVAAVDVSSFSSFVVVSRPKLEIFKIGTGAAHIKSAVDERVEINIPKGTFEQPVTITMEITDTPQKEDLKKVMTQCADISSTTSFYSLHSGGWSLSKPIAVKVPLPVTYTGQGKLMILTMNDDPAKEAPESWKLLPGALNINKGRIEFDVPSFSIKVAVESSSPIPDNETEFGSSTSFRSIASQVSRIYRKSRRKEHAVTFVCMTRRVGTSNTFRAIAMCCKVNHRAKHIAYWEGEGFENQDEVKHLNNELEIRARAKQVFKVKSKTLEITGEQKEIYLTFQPKLDKSYQQFTMTNPASKTVTIGHLDFYKMEKKETEKQDLSEVEHDEKISSIEVTLLTFNPKMMEQLDGRSFLTYKRVTSLQKDINDIWWKVLLLMDLPFKTLEKTLSDNSFNIGETVNGILFDWKEENRSDKSRGIPVLMSALCRSGKRLLVNDLQRQLREWKGDPKNRSDSFYEWLITAYKYDLLVPTRYDSPMSDTFLAMLADHIKPTAKFAAALSVPAGIASDVLANQKKYPTDGMKSMKILDHFRMGMSNKPLALKKLVAGLRELNLKQEADYAIMMTGAWLKRQQEEVNEFVEVYNSLRSD